MGSINVFAFQTHIRTVARWTVGVLTVVLVILGYFFRPHLLLVENARAEDIGVSTIALGDTVVERRFVVGAGSRRLFMATTTLHSEDTTFSIDLGETLLECGYIDWVPSMTVVRLEQLEGYKRGLIQNWSPCARFSRQGSAWVGVRR